MVSGYTLAFGLVPVLAGRLGDDHGRRLMFQVGVGSFTATSLLAGLAPSPEILIGARVLQGLAGGLINPQVSGLVQHLLGGNERGRAFGVLGTGSDDSRALSGVITKPGTSVLQVTPCGDHASAWERASDSSAPLETP